MSLRRAKLYEENGGYIVMTRDGGTYYSSDSEKNIFTDLDKALAFIKESMTQEIDDHGPKKKKAKAKKSPA